MCSATVSEMGSAAYTFDWIRLARSYYAAMEILWERILDPDNTSDVILPCIQAAGQATESALKAYIFASTGKEVRGHNLIRLKSIATSEGADISENDDLLISLLNKDYFVKTDQLWKYAARYPKRYRSSDDWKFSLATPAEYKKVVDSLCDQAAKIAGFTI